MANILITMAGLGSRFRKAGYDVPKYEIVAHGKTLFEWSMHSLDNIIKSNDTVIFVCLSENNSSAFINEKCAELNILNPIIYNIDEQTDGQATSAYLTKHLWKAGEPLCIYNIDTFVHPNSLKTEYIKESSDGWVPCFQAPGDHWSFIKINSDGWAEEATEKKRISVYASIGLYWFGDGSIFNEAYENFYLKTNHSVLSERYVAPLYQYLIENGLKVSITDIPLDDVRVLGTPAELDVFNALQAPIL